MHPGGGRTERIRVLCGLPMEKRNFLYAFSTLHREADLEKAEGVVHLMEVFEKGKIKPVVRPDTPERRPVAGKAKDKMRG